MEKRKHPRVDAKIKVAFRSLDDLTQEYTHNISLGGLFVKTDKLLDPNALIELEMSFPGDLGTYKVTGRVTRLMSLTDPDDTSRQLYGVGVKFIDASQAMLRAIESAIKNR